MRSTSILKISLAVLLFIAPAFTQVVPAVETQTAEQDQIDQLNGLIDDGQVIINQSQDAYTNYLQCVGTCATNNQDWDCYYQCSNDLQSSLQTVISLFRFDNQYTYDVESRLLTEDSPVDFGPVRNDLERLNVMRNSAAAVRLFALEKFSKATFDPLALVDTSIYEDFSRCTTQCTTLQCFNACYEAYNQALARQSSFSLPSDVQGTFDDFSSTLQQLADCMAKAQTQADVEACGAAFGQPQSLLQVTLNENEKSQVQPLLDQASQVTQQVKSELPARAELAREYLNQAANVLQANASEYNQLLQDRVQTSADRINAELPQYQMQVVQEIDQSAQQIIANLPQAQEQIGQVLDFVADQAQNNMTAYSTQARSVLEQIAAAANDAVAKLEQNQQVIANKLGLQSLVKLTAGEAVAQKLFDSSIQINNQSLDAAMNAAILVVSALAIVGLVAFLVMRRAKKQATKAQLVKPSEIKRQRKEKILVDEEDSFPIESTL